MTEEEKQKKIEELQGEICAFTNLLEQGDYKARKLIAELGSIIRAKFPDADMPMHDKYLAAENEAQHFRNEINRLEKEIEELKK